MPTNPCLTMLVTICLASGVATVGAQSPTAPADELEGLWKANRTFTPTAHGPLIIERQGATYVADMVGQRFKVRVDSGELSFQLPDAQGKFLGKLQGDGNILGHWYPPNSPSGFDRIVPVTLRATGRTRWSGDVIPADDQFTFYLLLRRKSGGSGALRRDRQYPDARSRGDQPAERQALLLPHLGAGHPGRARRAAAARFQNGAGPSRDESRSRRRVDDAG